MIIQEHSCELDLGDFADNYSAFHRALALLRDPATRAIGKKLVHVVREHIFRTKEVQSLRWLLPKVNETLDAHPYTG